MNIKVVDLTGLEAVAIESGIPCQAAVFKSSYKECSNTSSKKRGKWALCAPHGRLDELEVVDRRHIWQRTN